MFIQPVSFQPVKNEQFIFGADVAAIADRALCNNIFAEFWHGFCANASKINFQPTNEHILIICQAEVLPTPKNGYILQITKTGVSISAVDSQNLIYGFFALLDNITTMETESGKEKFSIPCCTIQDEGAIKTRMIHLCIFPETTLYFAQKFIRTAAFLRYTHIIIEFWGMLQLDCLKALSWKNAFTKDDFRPLLQEAKALGLQPIPMFNHWGHATASRVRHGKHVVLDQAPELAPLFDITGWNWNLENAKTKALHKQIRRELMELFGGEYFHIGCDEAYGSLTEHDFNVIVDYINEVSAELSSMGVKTIMWGDMLLYDAKSYAKETENRYYALAPSEEAQKLLLEKLSRSVLIADWQYDAKKFPIETALFFQNNGFEVFCCPFDFSLDCLSASAKTVKEYNLNGIIHTTWHTLSAGMPMVGQMAALAWEQENAPRSHNYLRAYLASIMRKVCPPQGEYEQAGWSKIQIRDIT